MKIKRTVISIVSVVLIFLMVASFIPLSYLLRPQGMDNDNLLGFYCESPNSLDMIYIGGSACFTYWEPLRAWNQHGFTSYNFAHNTITPESIKYYIKEVQKTQSPKLWLIDIRPFQYGEEIHPDTVDTQIMNYEVAIRNGTDHMLYSKNRNDLIKASVKDKSERMSYYIDFIKYHSNWGSIGKNLVSCIRTRSLAPLDTIDNKKRNPLKGFYFVEKTASLDFTDWSSVTEEKIIPAEVNDIFLDLIDYCKQENLPVLFIVHSYCQAEEHKMEYNYMKRVIEENGFGFLNTNDYFQEIGLDYSMDLYNEYHVNVFGAEKYTDFVSEYIVSRYDLPDKREQSDLEEWNTLYDDFEKRTEKVKKTILSPRDKQSSDDADK